MNSVAATSELRCPALVPEEVKGITDGLSRAALPYLLVVDDEEGPRQSLRIIFKEDYQVLLAENGFQALDLARRHAVAVVILDIRMAGLSGIDVLRRLKDLNADIQVILLTAYETVETARQAVRLGACDYLSKPFDLPTISAAVRSAFQRHSLSEEVRQNTLKLQQFQEEIQSYRLQVSLQKDRGELYASLIHDINGPLTIISGFLQIINQRMGDAPRVDGEALALVKERLARVTRQVNNCIEISRRYLSFLRERGGSPSTLSINQLLRDLEELVGAHPSLGENQLIVRQLPCDVQVCVNKTDLIQMLLNLTINALQATPKPHRVHVASELLTGPPEAALFPEGPGCVFINRRALSPRLLVALVVQDDGPGIPWEFLEHIFDPYFTTKSTGQGTGLGLAIVKRLITQAGGGLHLQTRPGRGTIFTLFLPVTTKARGV
jgi:signal transduction histidine kinase